MSGQVSGNTITGDVTGTHQYWIWNPWLNEETPAHLEYDIGSLDGAFYGPAGEEAAGTFSLEMSTGSDRAVGGFWGQKQ
jgi:hypothetical protein